MLSTHEAILDIAMNCVVEEKWVLLYQAKLRSPPIQVDTAEALVADCNCAVAKIIGNGICASKLVPSRDEPNYCTCGLWHDVSAFRFHDLHKDNYSLFPEPLGPTIAVVCPGLKHRLKSCRTLTSWRDGYAKLMFLSSMTPSMETSGPFNP
jgi:hypothetical protein